MTVSPYASDAKISEALTAIGAELIGVTEQQLLQQILVAAATASGGGSGGSVAFSAITGSPTDNTNLAAALNAKLNLTGGTLTGSLTVNTTSGECLLLQKTGTTFLRVRDSGLQNGAILESLGAPHGGQLILSGVSGGCYFGRRDNSNVTLEAGFEAFIGSYNSSGVCIRGSGSYSFGDDNGNNLHTNRRAGFYYGGATNSIQMGANHATTPTAQVFKAHNVTTGTGADMSIRGGTGSVADGYVRLGTATGGLAFFGTGGSVQYQGDVNTNVTSSGSGDSVLVDTQFDGGSGNSYTIGGIIKALKAYGILG